MENLAELIISSQTVCVVRISELPGAVPTGTLSTISISPLLGSSCLTCLPQEEKRNINVTIKTDLINKYNRDSVFHLKNQRN